MNCGLSKKRRAIQQASLPPVGIGRVPWRLIDHAFHWLNSATELSRAQDCCKQWRALSFDSIWQRHYLRDFEEASANDGAIATSGDTTPWRQRYLNRLSVQRNQRELRFSKVSLRNEDADLVGATASFIVFQRLEFRTGGGPGRVTEAKTVIRVCSLPSCDPLYEFETAMCKPLVVDAAEPKLVLAIDDSQTVQLRALQTGDLIRSWKCDFRRVTLASGPRLLVLRSTHRKGDARLLVLDLEQDAAPTEALSSVDSAECRVTQDQSRVLVVGTNSAEVWHVRLQRDRAPHLALLLLMPLSHGAPLRMPLPPGDRILRASPSDGITAVYAGEIVFLRVEPHLKLSGAPLEKGAYLLCDGDALTVRRGAKSQRRFLTKPYFNGQLIAVTWRYCILQAFLWPEQGGARPLLLLDFATVPEDFAEEEPPTGSSAGNDESKPIEARQPALIHEIVCPPPDMNNHVANCNDTSGPSLASRFLQFGRRALSWLGF